MSGLSLCATHYMQLRRRGKRGKLTPIQPKRAGDDLVDVSVRVRPSTFRKMRTRARAEAKESGRHTGAQRIARLVLETYFSAMLDPDPMAAYRVGMEHGPVRRFMGTRGMTIALGRGVRDALVSEHRTRAPNASRHSAPAVAAEVLERWADTAK